MTDDTQPEAMDLADWLEAVGGGPSAKRCAALRSCENSTPASPSLSRSLHSALTQQIWLRQRRRGLGMGWRQ